jgi:hypothetical protein
VDLTPIKRTYHLKQSKRVALCDLEREEGLCDRGGPRHLGSRNQVSDLGRRAFENTLRELVLKRDRTRIQRSWLRPDDTPVDLPTICSL